MTPHKFLLFTSFCPAEIKEIKEILAAHDNLNDILRRRNFFYFLYFSGTLKICAICAICVPISFLSAGL